MRRKRAKRGSVQVAECNGSLRLLWTHQGQRYTLALGLRDIPWHKKLANDRALWMEQEIKYGRFNPDKIEDYRTFLNGETISLTELPKVKVAPLGKLWQQYVAVKSPGKSPATVRQYGWVANHIKRLPTDDMQQVQTVLDAIARLEPDVQKRLLTQFSACMKWAQRAELVTDNPFLGMAAQVKVPQRGTVEDEINPFSTLERDQITQAFRSNRYYRHYANLVEFLFLCGARPCEVTPLQWQHVNADCILFNQSRVYTGKGYQTQSRLKTQNFRRFPMNHQLQAVLEGMEKGKPDALVFPSPEGSHIDWHNFTNRAWRSILNSLPEIAYRNPYQMRHSFISHCKEKGVPSIIIAEWVGNSVTMIDRVYARPTQSFNVPDL